MCLTGMRQTKGNLEFEGIIQHEILQKLRLNVDLKTVIITEMHLNKKMVFHLPSTGNLKEISNKNIRFYS